jgi:hypothetical protein
MNDTTEKVSILDTFLVDNHIGWLKFFQADRPMARRHKLRPKETPPTRRSSNQTSPLQLAKTIDQLLQCSGWPLYAIRP